MKLRYGMHEPLNTSDVSFWFNAPEFDGPGFHAPAPEATAPSPLAAPPTPVVLPDETAEAQAAVSGSSSGGVGSVVAETSGGLTINLIFDAAAVAAPASFRAGMEQAALLLDAAVSDKITLNFNIDYSGTGGGAAAGPDGGQWVSYSTVRSDLVNNASAGRSMRCRRGRRSRVSPQSLSGTRSSSSGACWVRTTPRRMTEAPPLRPTSTQAFWSASRCMSSLTRWAASPTARSRMFSTSTGTQAPA
jgi:hypothetical protein